MHILQKIKYENNIKYTELAKKLGSSPVYLSQIIKGNRHPSLKFVKRIIQVLADDGIAASFEDFRPDIAGLINPTLAEPPAA